MNTQAQIDNRKTAKTVTTIARFLRWKIRNKSRSVGSRSGMVFKTVSTLKPDIATGYELSRPALQQTQSNSTVAPQRYNFGVVIRRDQSNNDVVNRLALGGGN
jgi:hypothetical protein